MVNLSIIIPHYNSSSSLKTLLQTIPNLKDIQTIVIDDNSNEKHKEELVNLKLNCGDKNIEFYNNDTSKKGAGACRNIGLKRASGKWLLFADSDDYFLEGFYKKVHHFFESANDIIFFAPTSIEIDTGKISDRHLTYSKLIENQIVNPSFKTEVFLRYCFYVPWTKLIRANLVCENNIMFDEVIASNDVMFSTKTGYHMKKFVVSQEVIYCVTRNKGSLTTTVSDKIYDARLNVFINQYKFLQENVSSEEFKALNLSGMGYISKSMNHGVRKTLKVYSKLKINNILVFNPKIFNPVWFFNKVIKIYLKNKKNKKYVKNSK
ncbi:hypothetical protein CIL05_00060 [Virgibacillus profundi]|uniref:Glycosyltransferase 2-like domain-containing protein n=1 Tax=Virgibacillus profundi TaxID=2024555 RepID=A0A2A2IIW0_9BACI|nr:glycosyltransferase family A protein [Virgibacillus profundi]PAV31090.1 hypothetical protein CIL05_00060 [Virgibacillus profundi]PXY55273.1 glycosyltransferase family 2 protein [Virgibacillus profundi]